MKRILVGITTVASLLSMNAFAADLSPRTYTKAPMMVEPGFNWSGFYVGGNVGYSWGSSGNSEAISRLNTGLVLFNATSRNDVNGVIGGGQIGYNWQSSNWLFGLEADIQGSGERGSSSTVCVACADDGTDITSTLKQKLDWFGTLRGRAGILVTPTVLLYGTGGLAYGDSRRAAASPEIMCRAFRSRSLSPVLRRCGRAGRRVPASKAGSAETGPQSLSIFIWT